MVDRTPEQLEGDLLEEGSVVVRRLQLRAYQTISSATPKDTGTAQSAWTPTVGSPIEELIEIPSDRGEAESRASSRRAENERKARSIASTYDVSQGSTFLSNNLPYIDPLNRGTSAQAPANFIERAIDTAIRTLR